MSLLLLFKSLKNNEIPELVLKALLEFGDRTREGPLVQAVALPWFEIMDLIRLRPAWDVLGRSTGLGGDHCRRILASQI
jgi:hypothetical protein